MSDIPSNPYIDRVMARVRADRFDVDSYWSVRLTRCIRYPRKQLYGYVLLYGSIFRPFAWLYDCFSCPLEDWLGTCLHRRLRRYL
jgi:hypothetical protein